MNQSPYIWTPKRGVILPGKQIERYACMPAAILAHRRPMKPVSQEADIGDIDPTNLIVDFQPVDAHKFQDSGATTPVSADNDPLGHWANQGVETTFDAVMSTSDRRPLHRTNVQNGLNAVQFGQAASVNLQFNNLATYMDNEDSVFTIGIAFKKSSNTGTQTIFGTGFGAGSDSWQLQTVGTTSYTIFKDDGSSSATATGGTPNTSWHWATIIDKGTTIDMWLDGTQIITNAACNVGELTLSFASLGAYVGTTINKLMDGYIGRFMFWDADETANVTQINTLGMAQWGLS